MFFRIRLAAADAKGQLDFFKGTKWAGKTVRQRIKFNSVLYVVPWVSEPIIKTRLPLVFFFLPPGVFAENIILMQQRN